MTAVVKITRSSATAEIACIQGDDAFQYHSRSLILIPIETGIMPYATSYWWIILTYILSRTVCKISRSI